MTIAFTAADRTALGDEVAADLARWANLLVEILARAGHTPATADLICSSDADTRLHDSVYELAEHGGPIPLDRLHTALPVLLRPLLGGNGYPRITDLLAAAIELIDRAGAAHAITTAINGTTSADADPIGSVDAHLQFAASVLRQALTLLERGNRHA